jgi:hypothetical protein
MCVEDVRLAFVGVEFEGFSHWKLESLLQILGSAG